MRDEELRLRGMGAGSLVEGGHFANDVAIDATRNGADIQRVRLPEAVKGADGLILRGKDRLTVVQNSGTDQVVDLVSSDGWKSATLSSSRNSAQSFPTTGIAGGQGC